jgi:hypothetical protein
LKAAAHRYALGQLHERVFNAEQSEERKPGACKQIRQQHNAAKFQKIAIYQ